MRALICKDRNCAIRISDAPPHHHHQEKSERQKDERGKSVLDTDRLVIGRENVFPPKRNLMMIVLIVGLSVRFCRCCAHTILREILRLAFNQLIQLESNSNRSNEVRFNLRELARLLLRQARRFGDPLSHLKVGHQPELQSIRPPSKVLPVR